MDNAYYQTIYENMKNQSFSKENVFEQLMEIINE
jgi:hypothetical protein